jgi:very-short-patch-repair endonuclease
MKNSHGTMLQRAKAMRSEPTIAEARLWYHLRASRLNGIKFRRQVPIGPFIADFVAPAHKLIVEVDGDTHGGNEAYDRSRTDWLQKQGYRVIRFNNADVMGNEAVVLEAIVIALASPPLPGPLPASGEREQ